MIMRALAFGLLSACVVETMGCATPEAPAPIASQEYGGTATAVLLEKAVHFTSAEEADVVAPAGRYQVEPTVEGRLRLTPEGEGAPLLLAAATTDSGLDLSAPIALAVPSGEDVYHLMLLLPYGTALDAVGSYSGTRTRGPSPFLSSTTLVTALDAKRLFRPESPAVRYTLKDKIKIDALIHVALTVQPGATASGFQDCAVITSSGYVSSVVAQDTLHSPPGPGVPGPVTTQPRTGYFRTLPAAKNPYRCSIGSVTVTSAGGLARAIRAGDVIQLRVTSFVSTGGYPHLGGYWVEDLYQRPASGPSVTFPQVVVGAAFVDTNSSSQTSNMQSAVARMPNGASLGFEPFLGGTSGGRVGCIYKPMAAGYGGGGVTCPPGRFWPINN